MAFAGFSKSPVAAAASLLVALTGFAAVAATPGFAVTEKTTGTTPQKKSLAPNKTAVITVTVTRSSPDEARPMLLTLNFTLPSGVDFGSVTGCDLPTGFDPSTSTPTCTITDPFAFDPKANSGAGAFGTKVTATITVSRHFDSTATTCSTTDLGDVTVNATTDAGDNATAFPAVTIGASQYADIDVTATAPATANRGATISKTDTVNNVSVNNQTQTLRTSGYANAGADQADPNAANDTANTATAVPNDSGGCSSGGAVGPMALLGLMLLFSRKRRTA